ncbi:MAG: HAD family hydrolase [Deltaproteobacteria bacterium]|nr:HAD family hydrolase [Deltaproteobacteria bacterium]
MRAAAFFDLDGTLLTVNSAKLWVRYERRLGRLSVRQAARGAFLLARYRLGTLDMERVLREVLGTVAGLEEEALRQETRAWWRTEVRPFVAPGARAVIDTHRKRGEPVVLLTSSSRYASEMAREEFGLDDILYQAYEVRDGRFTGLPLSPICYGPGKVDAAEAWARAHDVDVGQSSFYSDSSTDIPMLSRVARAFAVHPDPVLRWTARRRGWPTLDWRR